MLFYLVVDLRVLQRENKKINAIVPMIQTRFSLVMIHTVFFFFKFIRKSRQNAWNLKRETKKAEIWERF